MVLGVAHNCCSVSAASIGGFSCCSVRNASTLRSSVRSSAEQNSMRRVGSPSRCAYTRTNGVEGEG